MSDVQNPTITLNLPGNRTDDFVLVPVQTFRKWQEEELALRETLKQKQELVEALAIIREGEEEYRTGKTTTEPLTALME